MSPVDSPILRRVVVGHLPDLAARLERATSTADLVDVLTDARSALCLIHAADGHPLETDREVRDLLFRWREDALEDLARADDLDESLEETHALDHLIGACA